MRIIILFISLIVVFSCKKKEDPQPVKASHELKIVYKSEDPTGMNVWCTTTNKFYFNQHISAGTDYTFTQTIQEGQNLQASISSPSGYWKTMIVIFNSDTLYNQKKSSDHACNLDL